jgi:hypothetical protein
MALHATWPARATVAQRRPRVTRTITCGRHLIAAKLRRADIDASAGATEEVARIVAQIRARWPKVKIITRADSGFARDQLMSWCEENRVEYVLGLARNGRLVANIEHEMVEARAEARETNALGHPSVAFSLSGGPGVHLTQLGHSDTKRARTSRVRASSISGRRLRMRAGDQKAAARLRTRFPPLREAPRISIGWDMPNGGATLGNAADP